MAEIKFDIIAVTDKFKSGIDDAVKKLTGFSAMSVAKGVLTADAIKAMSQAVLKFSTEAVQAYAKQEVQLTRLSAVVGKDTAKAFADYAAQLQKSTTYADDAIIAVQTQLAQFGILPGSIKESTKAIIDYAAATGKDLPSAGESFLQAIGGQSRELKRMGLNLVEGATRTENLERVTEFLQKRFEGMGELIRGTTLGTFQNFQNRLGDMKKRIGEELTPVVKDWTKWMESAIAAVEKLTAASGTHKSVSELGAEALRKERTQLLAQAKARGEALNGVTRLTEEEQERVVMLTRQIKVLEEQVKSEKKVTAELKEQKGVTEDLVDAGEQRMASLRKQLREETQIQGRITEINELEVRKRIAAWRNSFEMTASYSQQIVVRMQSHLKSEATIMANIADSFVTGFSNGFADIILEGAKFRDVMKDIGRQILHEFVSQVIAKMVASWIAGIAQMSAASGGITIPGLLPGVVGGGGGGSGGGSGGGQKGDGGTAGTNGLDPRADDQNKLLNEWNMQQEFLDQMTSDKQLGISSGGGPKVNPNAILAWHEGKKLEDKMFSTVDQFAATDAGKVILDNVAGNITQVGGGGDFGAEVNAMKNATFGSAGMDLGSLLENVVALKGGMATGGMIDEPSLVIGQSGRVRAAGEAGPEAVVPMGKMGGDIHIHITGQFIEADPSKWDKIAREHIVPVLERYREKTAASRI